MELDPVGTRQSPSMGVTPFHRAHVPFPLHSFARDVEFTATWDVERPMDASVTVPEPLAQSRQHREIAAGRTYQRLGEDMWIGFCCLRARAVDPGKIVH
jgi:hypothetical protein